MATANEQWQDALLRHQIGLLRLNGTLRKQIIDLLNSVELELSDRIRRYPSITPARARVLERFVRDLRGEIMKESRGLLSAELRNIASAEVTFLSGALVTVAPVLLDPVLPTKDLLNSIVTSRPFEGRVLNRWMRDLERADRERIMDAIRIGMVQGDNTNAIARRVVGTISRNGRDGVTQATRRAADGIVRTAIIHVTNQAKQEFYRANASTFDKELYVATLDGRTTPICRSLDGRTFSLGEGPVPPLHFNCRSVRIAYIDDEFIGVRPAVAATQRGLLREYARANGLGNITTRSSLPRGHKGNFDVFARRRLRELTGTVPARTTYQQWLNRQSASFQDDVLGPTRGRLFRRGGLTLDRFVNRNGDELTLSELARRDREAFIAAGLDPGDY